MNDEAECCLQSTTTSAALCEFEVTVCTGFEMTAKEEIEEKLSSASNVTAARGRVNLLLPINEARNVRHANTLLYLKKRF